MDKLIAIICFSSLFISISSSVTLAQASKQLKQDTTLYLQNTNSTASTVTVEIFDSGGSSIALHVVDMPPDGNKSIDGSTLSLPDNFCGSGVVTSTQPMVGSLQQQVTDKQGENYGTSSTEITGLQDAGNTVYLPLVRRQNDFADTLSVQNISASPVTTTITYYGTGCTPSCTDNKANLAPSATWNFTPPDNFQGSAVITSPGDNVITSTVGMVLASVQNTNFINRTANTYNGLSDEVATNNMWYISHLYNQNNGWNSQVFAQNAYTTPITNTLTYYSDVLGAPPGSVTTPSLTFGMSAALTPGSAGWSGYGDLNTAAHKSTAVIHNTNSAQGSAYTYLPTAPPPLQNIWYLPHSAAGSDIMIKNTTSITETLLVTYTPHDASHNVITENCYLLPDKKISISPPAGFLGGSVTVGLIGGGSTRLAIQVADKPAVGDFGVYSTPRVSTNSSLYIPWFTSNCIVQEGPASFNILFQIVPQIAAKAGKDK